MTESHSGLVGEFANRRALLERLGPKVEGVLRECLAAAGIRVHSVTHRVKEIDSLTRKLSKSGEIGTLDSITDLLGLRVITYFPDDVDKVAGLIEAEMRVDQERSTDKRVAMDPDRFGYLSVHFIAELGESRRDLPEYRQFTGVAFEIQIRSILQHAWAEIEHDLGYKAREAIPARARRQFSMLAGLLELADEEFRRIRDDLAEYGKEAATAVVEAPDVTPIDAETIREFAESSPRVKRLDRVWAKAVGSRYDPKDVKQCGGRSTELLAAGLETVGDIERAIDENEALLIRFMNEWAGPRPAVGSDATRAPVELGRSLFFLGYIVAGATSNRARMRTYLEEAEIMETDAEREVLADRLLTLLARLRKVDGSDQGKPV